MEKRLQELFRLIFLGTHTIQTVLKYIWIRLCTLLNDTIDVNMSSLRTLMHVLCNKTSSALEYQPSPPLPPKHPTPFFFSIPYLKSILAFCIIFHP